MDLVKFPLSVKYSVQRICFQVLKAIFAQVQAKQKTPTKQKETTQV